MNLLKLTEFNIIIIMNVMNIAASSQSNQYNSSVELNVLVLFYFAKLFFNYCILMFSKNNLEKIDTSLTYSYVFQLILFGFLIYSFTKIKKDYYFIILLLLLSSHHSC